MKIGKMRRGYPTASHSFLDAELLGTPSERLATAVSECEGCWQHRPLLTVVARSVRPRAKPFEACACNSVLRGTLLDLPTTYKLDYVRKCTSAMPRRLGIVAAARSVTIADLYQKGPCKSRYGSKCQTTLETGKKQTKAWVKRAEFSMGHCRH